MDALEACTGKFDAAIEELEKTIQPYLDVSHKTLVGKLGPLDNARLHMVLSSVMLCLSSSYLRISGVDVQKHPISEEFRSLKRVSERIKECQNILEERANASKQAPTKPIYSPVDGMDKTIKKKEIEPTSYPTSEQVTVIEEELDNSTDEEDVEESVSGTSTKASSSKLSLKRGRDASSSGGNTSSGPTKRTNKGRTFQGGKSTPTPELSHLNWRQEMEAKFKRK